MTRTYTRSRLLLALAAVAVASAALAATPASFEATAARLREATKETSGVAVLAARDGAIVFQAGFGFADLEQKKPVTTDTKFCIGSITKQFTAAAILRLAERKALDLADPLEKYFPGFPHGKEITLRQMLNHTSGLHSYTDKPEFAGWVGQKIEPAELIARFRDDPPDFAPGAGFHYSNSGYFLLGEIVAKVSGQPFGAFLASEFFEPLGMKDTGLTVNASLPPNLARGYAFTDGKAKPAMVWDMSWTGGAGAIYSTVGDLFRWNEALFGGRVLTPSSFKAATTPIELPETVDGMAYGFGLMVFEVERLPTIGHSGGFSGWNANLLRLPDQHATVVVLTNALPPVPGVGAGEISLALAKELASDAIAALPPRVEDSSVDPRSFAGYVGRYSYQGAVMTVSVEGEALFAQLTGQPRFRIFPAAPDRFFWKVVDAEARFLRDADGKVVAMRHSQNGNVFTAPRLQDGPGIPEAQLDAIVGRYRYGLSVLTVTREGSQLLAQLTGQPQFPIFPRSESEFEWHVVDASVRFVRDENGKVTKAVHTQNGVTFDAPRIPEP